MSQTRSTSVRVPLGGGLSYSQDMRRTGTHRSAMLRKLLSTSRPKKPRVCSVNLAGQEGGEERARGRDFTTHERRVARKAAVAEKQYENEQNDV